MKTKEMIKLYIKGKKQKYFRNKRPLKEYEFILLQEKQLIEETSKGKRYYIPSTKEKITILN